MMKRVVPVITILTAVFGSIWLDNSRNI